MATHAPEHEVGAPEHVGSWWSRDGQVEIDVVGVGRHRCVLLGSCKWRRTVGTDVLDDLYEQRAALGGKAAQVRLAVFGRERFSAELRGRAADENVVLVNAKRLVA